MSGIEIDNFDVPDVLPIVWDERGSGTINVICERFNVDFSGTFYCDSDMGFDIWVELVQGDNYERLEEEDLYNDYGYIDWSNACHSGDDWNPDGESIDRTILTEEEIITQYSYGSFDDFTPGQAEIVIRQGDENLGNLTTDQEWRFDVEIPSEGLPIAENVEVTNLSATTLPPEEDEDIEVGITFENPANHGVEFTADYEVTGITHPVSYTIPGVSYAGGTNVTTVTDRLNVNEQGYETVQVCYAGVCDTTDNPVGEPPSFSEGNVEIVKCSANITAGQTSPGQNQTLELEAEVSNGNYQQSFTRVKWLANGEEISRQDEVVDSKDATKLFRQVDYNLPVGDTEISVEVESVEY